MNKYERLVYHWGDFFGDVGGMGQFVNVVGQLIVSILSARLFYASLIRDTFRVRLDTGGAEMKNLEKAKHRESEKIVGKPWKFF